MAPVLFDPAFADVDDLLAFEQRVDDCRPFLEGRCRCIRRRATHAGQDNGWVEEIISEGLRLGAHFARPSGTTRVPAVLVLPGFPRGPGGAATVGNTDQVLCDRIAR